jgi:predicted N-acetyltransferase YhbS
MTTSMPVADDDAPPAPGMSSPSADALLEAHVALRIEALARHAPYARSDESRAQLREWLAKIHAAGNVRFADDGTGVRAVLAWSHDPAPLHGVPITYVAIDYDPAFDVRGWLDDALATELPRIDGPIELMVRPAYPELYRALVARGMGVELVFLVGDARAALRELTTERDPLRELSAHGLELAPLGPEHIEPAVELTRAAFSAEPQYCWYGSSEGFLSYLREEITRCTTREGGVERVLLRDGQVLAHCAANVAHEAAYGAMAGLNVAFAPELRGKGLLRPVYRGLLESAIAAGATTIKGATSQPPVLKLGAAMGRTLVGILMRRGTFFPESHFRPYLPLG